MNTEIRSKPAILLWTGGWDSTFRLLQLLLIENRPVETHYIVDLERKSTLKELQAMATIRQAILVRLDDQALFPPTKIFLRNDIPQYPGIADAYKNIRKSTPVGKQHEWLACYARFYDLSDVEVCLHWMNPPPPLHKHIFAVLDPASRRAAVLRQSPEVEQLFARFSFPLLYLTKSEMGQFAKDHGLSDILHGSWFCHRPIRGRPCGLCKPCRISAEQGRNIQYSRLAKIGLRGRKLVDVIRALSGRITLV